MNVHACVYILGNSFNAPAAHPAWPSLRYPPFPFPVLPTPLSLAVTTVHRGLPAHLGQVKRSCLVCSALAGSAGWGKSHSFKTRRRYRAPCNQTTTTTTFSHTHPINAACGPNYEGEKGGQERGGGIFKFKK